MPHVHVSRFEARSYELDSYRHLNNGVYVSWFEHARLQYLQSLGFSYDGFADRQQWIVVARTEVDFRAPLHGGDVVELETQVVALGRSSVRFRQVMRRTAGAPADPPAAEAHTVMVFSGPDGRSIPMPADFRAAVGPPGA
jgi:acyl-CoA thioester hydrolase